MENSEIDIDHLIDNYIKEKKRVQLNPFLITRIMSKIKDSNPSESKIKPAWSFFSLAIAVSLAVYAGITLGNSYHFPSAQSEAIEINDHTIENIAFYNNLTVE
jgi:hypothetical protein